MLFPRFVGNPWSYYVRTQKDFDDFISYNNGKNDCFWSHNAFADPSGETVWVQVIPWDFDDKGPTPDPRNTWSDVEALAELGRRVDVPMLEVSSGRKGFHNYLCFKPMLAKNNSALKDYYKAVQLWCVEQAGLQHWDKQLLGDTRRMMRIPGTIHPRTGKWCRRIDSSLGLDHVMSLSDRAFIPQFPEGKETLIEFCRRMGIKREMGRQVNFTTGTFVTYDDKKGKFDDFVRQVIPRVCIHNSLMTQTPSHPVRLEAVTTLINCGYDMEFVMDFMEKVSEHYNWHNRDKGVQNYHIGYLFRASQRKPYSPHRCEKLREAGLCIGPKCEMFSRAFPDEVTA